MRARLVVGSRGCFSPNRRRADSEPPSTLCGRCWYIAFFVYSESVAHAFHLSRSLATVATLARLPTGLPTGDRADRAGVAATAAGAGIGGAGAC